MTLVLLGVWVGEEGVGRIDARRPRDFSRCPQWPDHGPLACCSACHEGISNGISGQEQFDGGNRPSNKGLFLRTDPLLVEQGHVGHATLHGRRQEG